MARKRELRPRIRNNFGLCNREGKGNRKNVKDSGYFLSYASKFQAESTSECD